MNIKFLTALLLLVSFSVLSQEKRYIDEKGATTTAEHAETYETVEFSSDSIHKTIRKYSMDEALIGENVLLANSTTTMRDGKCRWFYPDGSVYWYGNFVSDMADGESKTYYEDGKVKREEVFSNGRLITGQCFDEDGVEIPYFPFEKRPEYPGGIQEAYKYVANNFHVKGTPTGTILVTFVVDKDGSITEVTIVKSLNKRMDKEAIRVVSEMPNWIPGEQEGRKVRARYTLPIRIAQQ